MPNQDTSMQNSNSPLRVLYDGGCPLCRREIAHYQRPRPGRPVDWIDIDADPSACESLGITRESAMARFHVLEGSQIHTGAEAFVVLWSALPGWSLLAALARGLRLIPVMELGYAWFAQRRWKKRCQDDRCAVI
ncbi:thiol-disulfide oxidoreductase DCC family protein [Thiorhodovibrio frisius]|uniref:Thiol-disulfide oxidoreductase DCC n=1 Tax=Thiorhodovibrio frisius TaxID=631362 RepID=H8YYY4_9GAMM|nr:DUF393 domain-containing protein [Thiorhodovibrio frisius]EIC23660.1 hypothetical protein Thi970DRAFT_01343 [Thiorhodovibrio frisius]WPL23248.1 hypothetical protein Thiofri_03433 [Thiorhodovibrio frisius]